MLAKKSHSETLAFSRKIIPLLFLGKPQTLDLFSSFTLTFEFFFIYTVEFVCIIALYANACVKKTLCCVMDITFPHTSQVSYVYALLMGVEIAHKLPKRRL